MVRMIALVMWPLCLLGAWAACAQGSSAGLSVGLAVGGPRPGFGEARLDLDPVSGPIAISGQRGEGWTMGEVGGGVGGAVTRRVVVTGDVSVEVGTARFSAARATIWVQALAAADAGGLVASDGSGLWQVVVYAEEVDSPVGDASAAFSSPEIVVEALVLSPTAPRLGVDSLVIRPGNSSFTLRSEAAFDRVLGRDRPASVEWVSPPLASDREQADGAEDGAGGQIFGTGGLFSLSYGEVSFRGAEPGSPPAILLTGGTGGPVVIDYRDALTGRSLVLSAQRAVVFLRGDGAGAASAGLSTISGGAVDGLYLEGAAIAQEGGYTLRGNRVFYSVARDRALVLDAVLSQYSPTFLSDVYVRARTIRQESPTLFEARGARVTNSAFTRPHISLGASRVTVTRRSGGGSGGEAGGEANGGGSSGLFADARNLTLRAGGVPVAWFPIYRGDPARFPLRAVGLSTSQSGGETFATAWDLFGLLGRAGPGGVDAELLLETSNTRGEGVGLDAAWRSETGRGNLFAFGRFGDTADETITSIGTVPQVNGENRGLVLFDYRADLTREWSVYLEVADTSDELFANEFFRELTLTSREFRTGATIVRRDGNAQGSLEVSGALDEYPVNQFLILTDGYQVERLPEARYSRFADNVFPLLPGAVTATTDLSIGSYEIQLAETTPNGLALVPAASQPVFGVTGDASIADAQRAAGIPETDVVRFDAREEVSVHLGGDGPVAVTPFAVGRVTAYDSTFDGISPDERSRVRTWGSVGVSASTSVQRVYEGVRSDLLDLHRLRHVIEPSATVWLAGTSIDQGELPVYDDDVESINEGLAFRLGLDQVFQTQRGGPGRWKSVDVLEISAEYVDASGDAERESPIGRFYDARPESSNLREYGEVEATLHASSAVALVGGVNFDFEGDQIAQSSAGVQFTHGSVASSRVEFRSLPAADSLILSVANRYSLTEKYDVDGTVSYDSESGDFQAGSFGLTRRFQTGSYGLLFTVDNVSDETSIGFILRPTGLGRGTSVGGIGSTTGGQGGGLFGR